MIPRNFRRWMRMFSSDLVLSEMSTFVVNEFRSIVEAAQRSLAEAGAAAPPGQCG